MTDAVYIHGARDVRLGPAPQEEPSAGTVEADIAAIGLCGSDLHYYKDGAIGSQIIAKPFIPGHEFSVVLKADVPSLDLAKGTLVAVEPAHPCGQCEWCHRGHVNLCPRVRFIGAPPHDGAMRRSMFVPVGQIIPIPKGMTALEAAMLEPLGVCIHAIDLARPRLGETVTVVGCGPIGLGIIQLLAISGVGRIIAVEPAGYRAAKAVELGADDAVPTVADAVSLTDGRGTDLVIEATNSPAGLADACAATRIGGRAVIVGIPDGDTYTMPAAEARRRGLSLKFSRRMGETYPRAIALAAEGRVDLNATVSHRVPLEATAEAFRMQADLTDNVFKTVIYPNGFDI